MATIEISSYFPAKPQDVRDHVNRPQLLEYVAHGMIRFKPLEPRVFPERWEDGEYKTRMYWKGFLPIGDQIIGIEHQPMRGDTWSLRDNGRSGLIRTWDHMLEVSPEGKGTRYVDHLKIEAGWLTPFVAFFARRFYTHRQKRWRRLIDNGFDYTK